MQMLFLGEISRSFSALEVYNNIEVVPIGESVEAARNAATKKEYDHIIIDIEPFTDASEQIAAVVKAIAAVTKSPIIIWAVGFSPQSNVVEKLKETGITRFVFAQYGRKQKEEFEAAIAGAMGTSAVSAPTPITVEPTQATLAMPRIQNTPLAPPTAGRPPKSIAVFGGQARMGTTTVALQLCKYLTLCGYNPCYVDVSGEYAAAAAATYNLTASGVPARIVCSKTTLFNLKNTDITAVISAGFDTLVYDCGNMGAKTFNREFAFDKEKRVLVCGTKPIEYDATIAAIKATMSADVWYMFNFVSEKEQSAIRKMMSEKAGKTLFVPYAPNPYAYVSGSNSVYSTIAGVSAKAGQSKGIFEKLFKKGLTNTQKLCII